MTGTDILSVFYEASLTSWITIETGLMMGFGAVEIVFGLGLWNYKTRWVKRPGQRVYWNWLEVFVYYPLYYS